MQYDCFVLECPWFWPKNRPEMPLEKETCGNSDNRTENWLSLYYQLLYQMEDQVHSLLNSYTGGNFESAEAANFDPMNVLNGRQLRRRMRSF